ncbi:hypothetical protein ACS8Y6_16800 [Salinisphaera sp. RV14]|uniref:hypothetical protein n=1 Tax=unclassified Salinisphaera TaxID=2649847 RepID=UPI003F8377E7
MFRSRHRERILPQLEHSLFSGLLAVHWGNARFDRPALDFKAFARGVALHDWHYGPLDNHPLGTYGDAEWQAIVERGVATRHDDPITDAVAKRHLRRLIGTPETPAVQALVQRLDGAIAERQGETSYSDADFEWADHITRFCDTVAFDLGFEHRGPRHVRVPAHRDARDETDVSYEIAADGVIRFAPWPFDRPDFGMPLTAYQASDYPDRLQPVVIFVQCVPGEPPDVSA